MSSKNHNQQAPNNSNYWGSESEGQDPPQPDEKAWYWGRDTPFEVTTHDLEPNPDFEVEIMGIEIKGIELMGIKFPGSTIERITLRGQNWVPWALAATALIVVLLFLTGILP